VFSSVLPGPRTLLDIGPSKVSTEYLPLQAFMSESKIVCIDIRALEHHENLKEPHRFLLMDATNMAFNSDTFDFILANQCLQYVPNVEKAFGEIRRVLTPTGVAMVNVHRTPEPTMTTARYRVIHPEISDDYIEMNMSQMAFGSDYAAYLFENFGFSVVIINYNANVPPSELERTGQKSYGEIILISRSSIMLKRIVESLSDRAAVTESVYAEDSIPHC
jgi:SAM-dependent methyltransferase